MLVTPGPEMGGIRNLQLPFAGKWLVSKRCPGARWSVENGVIISSFGTTGNEKMVSF